MNTDEKNSFCMSYETMLNLQIIVLLSILAGTFLSTSFVFITFGRIWSEPQIHKCGVV